MEVKRVGQVKQGDEVIGNETLVKVTKNKVAPPFKEASFQIMYGKGISKVGEVLDIALDNDIVQKSGAWFSFGDIRLGQGKENVKTRLENEKELFEEIEKKVLEIIEADENKISLTKKNLDDTSEDENIVSEDYDEASEGIDNIDEI